MYSGYGANIARIEIGRTYGGRTVLEPGEPYMKPNGRQPWLPSLEVPVRVRGRG